MSERNIMAMACYETLSIPVPNFSHNSLSKDQRRKPKFFGCSDLMAQKTQTTNNRTHNINIIIRISKKQDIIIIIYENVF